MDGLWYRARLEKVIRCRIVRVSQRFSLPIQLHTLFNYAALISMKDTAGNICGFWQLRSSFSAQAKKAVLQGGHIYFIEQQCKSALNLLYFFSFWSFLQLHCQSHSRYPEANFTSDLIKPCLQLEGRCTRSAAEVKSILGQKEVNVYQICSPFSPYCGL